MALFSLNSNAQSPAQAPAQPVQQPAATPTVEQSTAPVAPATATVPVAATPVAATPVAPVPTVTAPAIELKNLTDLIESLTSRLDGQIKERSELPDNGLGADIGAAIGELARAVGFSNYDPAQVKTFTFVPGKGDKNAAIYGPSLMAYGDSVCVRWTNDIVIPFAPDMMLSSGNLYMVGSGEVAPHLLVCPDSISYKLPIRLQSEYAKDKNWRGTKLIMLNMASKLGPYLQRGEPKVDWGEVNSNDNQILFHHITQENIEIMRDGVPQNEIRTEILGTLDGQPRTFWATRDQGDAGKWIAVQQAIQQGQAPVAVTKGKDDRFYTVAGHEFKIGGKYLGLAQLKVGQPYSVIGYEPSDKYEGQMILEVAEGNGTIFVRGNSQVAKRLKVKPVISAEQPATLICKAHHTLNDGKVKVLVDFSIPSEQGDDVSNLIANLQVQNAAKKAKASAAALSQG